MRKPTAQLETKGTGMQKAKAQLETKGTGMRKATAQLETKEMAATAQARYLQVDGAA